MKEVKIFLASSYELEADRIRFGDMIYRMNSELELSGFHLTLIKWEDLPGFYTPEGQQNSYDQLIPCCDIFIALFWHQAGKYTVNELNVAQQTNVASYIFLRDPDTTLSPEEANLYFTRHPDKPIEQFQTDENPLSSFLQEQKNTEQFTYSDFSELEAAFKSILDSKIKDFPEKTDNAWTPLPKQKKIIAFTENENELNFDLTSIRDLLRKLNQIKWDNYQISSEPADAGFMFCLNYNAVSDEQNDLIDHFNSQHQDSPLLLLQRKNPDKTRGQELKKWYSQKKQYSVSYSCVDNLLLGFIQHLLLHFPQENQYTVQRGTLFLKSFPAVNLLGTDEFSGEEIKTLLKKLSDCDEKVRHLKEKNGKNPFDSESLALYNEALNEQRNCLEELNEKTKYFLDLQLYFLKAHAECDLRNEYEEACKLWNSGKIDEFIKMAEEKIPSDEDVRKTCADLLAAKEFANKSYENKIAADMILSGAGNKVLEKENESKRHFYHLLCGVKKALHEEQTEEAITHLTQAEYISRLLADKIDQIDLALNVLLPLADLLYKACRWKEAIERYEKCRTILSTPAYKSRFFETINEISLHTGFCYMATFKYKEALSFLGQVTHWESKVPASIYIGLIQRNRRHFDTAAHAFIQAYDMTVNSTLSISSGCISSLTEQHYQCAYIATQIVYVFLRQNKVNKAQIFFAIATKHWQCALDEAYSKIGIHKIAESVPEDFSETSKKCLNVLHKMISTFPYIEKLQYNKVMGFAMTAIPLLLYNKKHKEAQECLRLAKSLSHKKPDNVDIGPLVTSAGIILGDYFQSNGFWDDALSTYRETEQWISPNHLDFPEVCYKQARILRFFNRLDEALSKLAKGFNEISNGVEYYTALDLTEFYYELCFTNKELSEQCEENEENQKSQIHLDAAWKACKTALELKVGNSDTCRIYYLQGCMLNKLEKFDDALAILKKIVDNIRQTGQLNFSADFLHNVYYEVWYSHKELADQYKETGEIQAEYDHLNAALKACKDSLELETENSSLLFRIGALYRRLQNCQEAWQNYQKAINLREEQYFSSEDYVPTLDDAAVYNEASRILFDIKDYSRALEYGRKGLDILCSHLNEDDVIVVNCRNFLSKIKEMIKQ